MYVLQLGLLELFLLLTLCLTLSLSLALHTHFLSHTHTLLLSPPLSFYSFLCLFAEQLYKPASLLLFLHTDRAIFSRHLISVGHSRSRLSGPFSLRFWLQQPSGQAGRQTGRLAHLPFAFGVFVSYCYGVFKCYFPLGSHFC